MYLNDHPEEINNLEMNQFVYTFNLDDLLQISSNSFLDYIVKTPNQFISDLKDIISIKAQTPELFPSHINERLIIHFTSNTNLLEIQCNEIDQKLGFLMEINGEIVGLFPRIYPYSIAAFQCEICGTIQQIKQSSDEKIKKPHFCTNVNCNNTKKDEFSISEENSISEIVQNGFIKSGNHYLRIKIIGKENILQPGDKVRIFGIPHLLTIVKGKEVNQQIICIEVNNAIKKGVNEFQEKLTDKSRIVFDNTSIALETISEYEVNFETLFRFDEIRIDKRYAVSEGPLKIWKYCGTIIVSNSKFNFYNADISEVKQILTQNCAVSGKNLNFSTIPIQNFLSKYPDDSDKITTIIGFTQDGWKLPHNSIYLIQDEMGNEVMKNIGEIYKTDMNLLEAKKSFKRFYEVTGIIHRDQHFQYMIASPFLYVFRMLFSLMPGFAMQGPAQFGKTALWESFIIKCYGHLRKSESTDSINSASRLQSLLASSTFPVLLDDVSNAKEEFVDFLKSHHTSDARYLRKGKGQGGQFANINKSTCASPVVANNDPPTWFYDDAYLERVYLENVNACEKIEGWFEARDRIPIGCILRILVEYTQDWNAETIKRLYNSFEIPSEIKNDNRKRITYSVFALGQKLLKEIFDIETSLTNVIHTINKTRSQNIDTLKALMEYQILHGKICECEKPQDAPLDSLVCKTKYFFPTDVWVKTPLYDAKDCYVWMVNNIRDLQTVLEGNNSKKWTLQTFLTRVQKWFPDAKIGKYYLSMLNEKKDLEGHHARGIAIPIDSFTEKESEKDNQTKLPGLLSIKDKCALIIKAIYDLQKANPKDNLKLIDIMDGITEKEISEEFVKNVLEQWVKDGTVYRPTQDSYKIVRSEVKK